MSSTRQNEEQAPQPALPKLRKGLTYTFNDYDYDGKPQWLIHDSGRNKFFIVGWPDYEMLMRWHLSDPEDLIYAVNNETTLHVEMNDLENLIQFLAYNYLIDQTGKKIYQTAKDQHLFANDNIFSWLITHYLFFRIPIWHPDKFLTLTRRFGEFLFSRYTLYVMMCLGVVAIYQVGARWAQFIGTFPSIISLQGLFYSFIAFSIVKVMHEAGHAYKCKEYNIPIPSCGLAFLVFWPVLYTDTTLSWTLNSKKRLRIALAGIQIESYVTIIAALIWCNTGNLTLQTICYVTITVNWMSSLLINVSPFMRFDGYYVLSDFLKMPNLQYRAFALTKWQIRYWLFGWQDPPPEKFSRKMHIILIAYSILTWLYRFSLYVGIAVLVYRMFFKALGIILFMIEVYYFMLDPFVKELAVWIHSKEKFKLNVRTIITCTIAISLLLLFFVPFRDSVKLPATIHYAHQFLFAPEEGILDNQLPQPGTKISANETIATIQSPILMYSLDKVQLEIEQLGAELRRASVNEQYSLKKSEIISNINQKTSELNKLNDIKSKLVIKVDFNGILIDAASELSAGTFVRKNEWLGDVINPRRIEVEAYAAQIDLDLLKPDLTGYFYSEDINTPKVPVTLRFIEPLNPTQLTCHYSLKAGQAKGARNIIETPCYNSSEFGGEIATFVTDKGDYVPVDSVHRVIFTTDNESDLLSIQRGHVIVKTTARSYADRFFYNLKRVFISERAF